MKSGRCLDGLQSKERPNAGRFDWKAPLLGGLMLLSIGTAYATDEIRKIKIEESIVTITKHRFAYANEPYTADSTILPETRMKTIRFDHPWSSDEIKWVLEYDGKRIFDKYERIKYEDRRFVPEGCTWWRGYKYSIEVEQAPQSLPNKFYRNAESIAKSVSAALATRQNGEVAAVDKPKETVISSPIGMKDIINAIQYRAARSIKSTTDPKKSPLKDIIELIDVAVFVAAGLFIISIPLLPVIALGVLNRWINGPPTDIYDTDSYYDGGYPPSGHERDKD